MRGLGVLILALVAWRVVTVGLAEGYPATFWMSQLINGLVLGGVYLFRRLQASGSAS